MKRHDVGRGAPASAMAKRNQIEAMGYVTELEPGALTVELVTGRVLRWVKVYGTDLWRLCVGEGE